MNHDRLFDVIEFATLAHRGQFRKVTEIPYIVHPLRVAQLLIEYGCPEEVVLAGILHDVLEDTSITATMILDRFGEKVAQLVQGASEPGKGVPWEKRKEHTLEYLKTAPLEVAWITCADKLDNIRSIHEDLQRLGEVVWDRFRRPKEKQRWYYQSLVSVLETRITEEPLLLMYRLFIKTVQMVFGQEDSSQQQETPPSK